jgi:UPF0716 protein FxsA
MMSPAGDPTEGSLPMWFVPALFLLWPFIEIAGFIAVGQTIGILPTIAAIILSSMVGAALLRIEGIRVLRQVFAELQGGRKPDVAIAHAGLVALGGALLVLPGFVSDVIGILLFLKPFRSAVIAFAAWVAGPYVEIRTSYRGDFRGANQPGVVDLDPADWSERKEDGPTRPRDPRQIEHDSGQNRP